MSRLSDKNRLSLSHPVIASEWHPSKNKAIKPDNVSYGESREVWWKCRVCFHEWKVQISHRTSRGTGCPKCKRKKASNKNSLSSLNPILASEWNYKRNKGLRPSDFTANSHKKVWWICIKCGHEWINTINHRNNIGNSCWRCKSLGIQNKELAMEWHPTKNKKLTPFDVSIGSHKKVWWKCLQCRNEWETTVHNRSKGRNCPACSMVYLKNGAICESIPEAVLYLQFSNNNIKFIHNKKYGKELGNRRYDFYLPDDDKYIEVTSFNRKSMGISWVKYLRNIAIKKKYVTEILKANFQFIQFVPPKSQILFVRENMKSH